jgi:putative flippase GtrA
MPQAAVASRPATLLAASVRFAGLSGVGWLIDFSLLLILVRIFALPVFTANLISAGTAGLSVFLMSRRMVFGVSHGSVARRALFYLLYTVVVIVLASWAIRLLAGGLQAGTIPWLARPVIAAAVAKILVTPVTLGLNFIVAKGVNEWGRQHTRTA